MRFSPDEIILWQRGFITLNSTIVTSWAIMAILTIVSLLVTRRLAHNNGSVSGWQSFLEIIVTSINRQIKEAGLSNPSKYISFIGTIFLFVAASSLFTMFPG
jgi:F-type H+-transporting ATPase subunit a